MFIYKVPSDVPYQRPFRILAGGAILLLVGIWLFSAYKPESVGHSTNKMVAMAAGAIVFGVILSAFLFSAKAGMWALKSGSQWELDGEKILRRGKDGRTNEIPLTGIKSLREDRGWLHIWGGEPPRQIAIPSEVNDFEELKAKLSAYCDLAGPKRDGFYLTVNFFPIILGLIAYACLLLSRNRTLVVISGVAALLLQGLTTYFFWLLWRKRWMPKSVILSLVLSCLVVAWIVYRRALASP